MRRRHRLVTRAYCDTCDRSFNIDKANKNGHVYSPEGIDHFGEAYEAHAICKSCLKDLNEHCDREGERMEREYIDKLARSYGNELQAESGE